MPPIPIPKPPRLHGACSSPTNGTATVSGNGSAPTTLSYQPNADYHGADSFSVQVTDGENNDSITIHLTINPVEEPFNGSFNWSNHAGEVTVRKLFSAFPMTEVP